MCLLLSGFLRLQVIYIPDCTIVSPPVGRYSFQIDYKFFCLEKQQQQNNELVEE